MPIHDRRIGIDLSDLKYIPKVVGVAGGLHKVPAILGALRGGFLDVLVTNAEQLAAVRLLELERRRSRRGPALPGRNAGPDLPAARRVCFMIWVD